MIAVFVFVAVVRLRLLNFPLERDEGEYAYAGQLMLQGIPPYELAYNMKFPGTYAAYAVIMRLFGETPAGIHLGILLMTTATALMLFWLGKKILDETAGIVAATAYSMLAASPTMLGLAGHATHFAAFFTTAGMCVLWLARQDGNWQTACASGLLFGTAVLMKQHAAIIGAWAGISFAAMRLREVQRPSGQRLLSVGMCAAGMFLPLGLCCLILWQAGVFGKFWFWTIDYARQYASIVTVSEAKVRFLIVLPWIVSTTALLWLLGAAGTGLVWFDERLIRIRLWLLGFGLASALTVFPGFYFREHYFLLMLPAVALLAGCAVSTIIRLQKQKDNAGRFQNSLMLVYALFLAAIVYVNRDIWLKMNPVQSAREVYGRDPFPEAQSVAVYIRTHSDPNAHVAVLGSEPEIYFLSRRHSVTGYIYAYALTEHQAYARQMQKEFVAQIQAGSPEFIVCAGDFTEWMMSNPGPSSVLSWWTAYRTNYNRVKVIMPPKHGSSSAATRPDVIASSLGIARNSGFEIYQRKPINDAAANFEPDAFGKKPTTPTQ